jgi:hypothetical protein
VLYAYDLFYENIMLEFEDSQNVSRQFTISDGFLPIHRYALLLDFELIGPPGYSLSPRFIAGGFLLETSHPDKDNFAKKRFWEIRIQNIVHRENWAMVFSPFYTRFLFDQKQQDAQNTRHFIHTLGLQIGWKWNVL